MSNEASKTRAEIASALSIALALQNDRYLRSAFGSALNTSQGEPFALGSNGGYAWLLVKDGEVSATSERPTGVPSADLISLLGAQATLSAALRNSLAVSSVVDEANKLVDSIFEIKLPDRSQIEKLTEFSPLFERAAYLEAARISTFLDDIRSEVIAGASSNRPRNPKILRYWYNVRSMANLTILASSNGSKPWMAEMANQFVWNNWTPTFTLTRERTLWLAACAAKIAAAFGKDVIDQYITSLATSQEPFKVFDGAFGLIAIGLSEPAVRDNLISELLQLQARDKTRSSVVRLIYGDAIAALQDEKRGDGLLTRLGFSEKDAIGALTTKRAHVFDPTDLTFAEGYLAFAIIRPALRAVPAAFYPTSRSQNANLSEISALIRRAWGITAQPEAQPEIIH